MSQIHFGGSRSLPPTRLVHQVVTAALVAGHRVRVGCAIGADAQVIQAALIKNASRLHVFAAFTEKGYGAWSGSATSAVDTAFRYGARVSYLPHVDLSIPLAGRLIRRSITALTGCNASVFFLATKDSYGSLAVAAEAVRRDLPVFAFCVGFWGHPLPPRGCRGRWINASFMGASALRWKPAQSKFF